MVYRSKKCWKIFSETSGLNFNKILFASQSTHRGKELNLLSSSYSPKCSSSCVRSHLRRSLLTRGSVFSTSSHHFIITTFINQQNRNFARYFDTVKNYFWVWFTHVYSDLRKLIFTRCFYSDLRAFWPVWSVATFVVEYECNSCLYCFILREFVIRSE